MFAHTGLVVFCLSLSYGVCPPPDRHAASGSSACSAFAVVEVLAGSSWSARSSVESAIWRRSWRGHGDGNGARTVFDSIGRDTFEDSLRSLAKRGCLIVFGQSSGPVPPFDLRELQRAGSVFLTRPGLGDYTATREELLRRAGVSRAVLEIRCPSGSSRSTRQP
jgi:hypothetical protein